MIVHSNQLGTQAKQDIFLSKWYIWCLKYTYICNKVTKNTPYWPIFYNTGISMHYYVHLVILSEFTSHCIVWCLQRFTQAVDGITAQKHNLGIHTSIGQMNTAMWMSFYKERHPWTGFTDLQFFIATHEKVDSHDQFANL